MTLSLSTLSREEQKEQIPCLHGAEEKTKTHTLLCEFTKSVFEDSNFTNPEVPTLCVYPRVWKHVCGRCPCVYVSKGVGACTYVYISACVCTCVYTCVQVHMHMLECRGQRSTMGLVL